MSSTASIKQNLAGFFLENGYLTLRNFLPAGACDRLIEEGRQIAKEHAASKFLKLREAKEKGVSAELCYYLAKETLCLFFKENASLDTCREEVTKISYTLHESSSAFRSILHYSDLLGLFNILGWKTPHFLQSMMLFKHPGSKGSPCHQDGSFIYSEPDTTLGLWFALEDMSQKQGCLYVIPGAHRQPLKGRLIATPQESLVYEATDNTGWDLSEIKPLEVTKGTLVVLHSHLPHGSFSNTTSSTTKACAFHLIDKKSILSPGNWLNG